MSRRDKVLLIGALVALALFSFVVNIIIGFVAERQSDEYALSSQEIELTNLALEDADFQEFLTYTESVLSGETVFSDRGNPLWSYSYDSSIYPGVKSIEADFEVLSAEINGDRAKLSFTYSIRYLNARGETIRYAEAAKVRPDTWWLEKVDGKWEITKVHRYP